MMERSMKDERSLGDLFSELAQETGMLVRQEVTLARTEITDSATRVGKNVGIIAAGGALAFCGLLAVIAAVILGLANFMPAWLSALLVGIIVIAIAALIAMPAMNALKRTKLAPTETVESIKEDAQWLKNQVS
jgi:hypothetical protein